MTSHWLAIPALALFACSGPEPSRDAAIATDAAALDATTVIDATAADAALDTGAPDADTRSATAIDCADVEGGTIGHTAEITDTTGYVPTGDATMPVGFSALYVYADGGGGVTHTIVSDTGLFSAGPVADHGDSICVRFDAPGAYPYHCGVHPNSDEVGTITVGE